MIKIIKLLRIIAPVVLIFSSFSFHAQSFDVDTIMMNGRTASCINIVLLGDGYKIAELSKFELDAKNLINAFFTQTPFSQYRNYFNVFIIKVPSNESGAATNPNSLIDNYFGSTFGYAGIDRLLVPTNTTNVINVLANNFPEYDQVIMLVNSPDYGGSGGWVATASTNVSVIELLLHETGHSFANLADEYWAGSQYAREAINMTQETNLEKLRWKNWYGDFDIGLYPHTDPTWYRPHQSCKMRALENSFCSVCGEGIIEQIHSLVSPLISYYPVNTNIDTLNFPIKFKIDLIEPDPNTLQRNWKLNNVPFDHNIDSVLLDANDLQGNSNILTVTIEDTTQLLRVDNHSTIHLSSVSWVIGNSASGAEKIISSSNDVIISLYPNPLNEDLHVKIQGEIKNNLKMDIYDMEGILQSSHSLNPHELNTLTLNYLNQGIYIAKIYIDNVFITSTKIIITE